MKISVIMGTRPEAIKLAPLILALKAHPQFECCVCATAQHRQMLDAVLGVFGIVPDTDLNLMQAGQSLSDLTARILAGVDNYLSDACPDMVLVQGDTTTAFTAALAAFYRHIPVAHTEAGLRTGRLDSPWPEEANRVLTAVLATLHFAPTEQSRQNLLREHIPADRILVTGNTVIDALFLALDAIKAKPPIIPGLPATLQIPPDTGSSKGRIETDRLPRVVLITGHRRENFGEGFQRVCRAIAALAQTFSDVHFVYPVHLNPQVREPVYRLLSRQVAAGNIHLIAPLDYLPFIALMQRSCLILTDSGGVQEEAPSLGKPVLVMRDTTERPEAVDAGTVQLVGTVENTIIENASRLLSDPSACRAMARIHNPYGDGKATARHIKALENYAASRSWYRGEQETGS